jgi:parallel beta-helix repeat protein
VKLIFILVSISICLVIPIVSANIPCGYTITSNTTLNGSMVGCTDAGIVFGANNIILDCNGYSIEGVNDPDQDGLVMSTISNSKVTNCQIKDFNRGIILEVNSSNNRISNTNINHQGEKGIEVSSSSNNIEISDVTITDANITGIYISESDGVSISDSKVRNNLQQGILIEKAESTTVKDSSFSGNVNYGVYIADSTGTNLTNLTLVNNSQ